MEVELSVLDVGAVCALLDVGAVCALLDVGAVCALLDVGAVCALGVTARPVRGGSGATSGITSSPDPPHNTF